MTNTTEKNAKSQSDKFKEDAEAQAEVRAGEFGMKIGMWNRLAIAVSVLALIVLPAWFVISANLNFIEAYEAGYRQCLQRAAQPNDGTLTFEACREIWPIGRESSYGWYEWGQALLATFIACILIYGLIWVVVQTVKWIWRGRQINE